VYDFLRKESTQKYNQWCIDIFFNKCYIGKSSLGKKARARKCDDVVEKLVAVKRNWSSVAAVCSIGTVPKVSTLPTDNCGLSVKFLIKSFMCRMSPLN
jgi:hypothetical protein